MNLNTHSSPDHGRDLPEHSNPGRGPQCSRRKSASALFLGLLLFALSFAASAQTTNLVLFEDFEDGILKTNLFQPDAPLFEGGLGDIQGTEANGILEFTGTVSQQWWAGATVRVVPTFTASDETNVVLSIDRVFETGQGSASRSAFWIMDASRTKYVLFADVRNEGGWRYNRKIGEAGDVPTGSGNVMDAFTDPSFNDGGFHRMKAVVNGKTVKLYLDDILGAEVKFPFPEVVWQVGAYARANGDTADTGFDNLKVETVGTMTFSTKSITVPVGQTASGITVRIPSGANAASAIQVRVVSSNPSVANPVGAVGGSLTLTFPAGGENTQTFNVQGLGLGGAQLTLENDLGIAAGNTLDVTVIAGPGIQLQDDFSAAAIDSAKWGVSALGFESGTGTFSALTTNGVVEITGVVEQQWWAGASLKSVGDFTATPDLPLTVDVDRVSVDPTAVDGVTPSTAARTGLYLTTDDRSKYVFFGQNFGESGWELNFNPGNPTGGGNTVAAFTSKNDTNAHHMRLVADGEKVEVFLDGESGGRFDFPLSSGIHLELGAYARADGDAVIGSFDNVKVENLLPCITVSPVSISTRTGNNSNEVTVVIPKLLNAASAATVTVTSSNPSVAVPHGAVGGVLTLTFPAGGPVSQTFTVDVVGLGATTFNVSGGAEVCVSGSVSIGVALAGVTLLSDDFATGAINTNLWWIDPAPLVDTGVATVDSGITVSNQALRIDVTADQSSWPGFALATMKNYRASATTPLSFEIDRVHLGFVLVTGTAAKERSGIWVKDATGTNYVFFSEFVTHDTTTGGWQYHRNIGQAGDNPVTGGGIAIAPFSPARFNDQENHRMKIEANGSTVRLYLDGVVGAEVAFPFSEGLTFEAGAYVEAATDSATALFDNALIQGASAGLGPLSVGFGTNGDVVVSWTGAGTLQSSDTLGASMSWSDVTPPPAGNSYTIPAASRAGAKFFRLR
jgi:hypothetical protein